VAKVVDYQTLRDAVTSYVVFEDAVDQFDTFLGLAESRLNRDLRVPEMVEESTLTFGADTKAAFLSAGSFDGGSPTRDVIEFLSISNPNTGALMMINPDRLMRLSSYWSSTAKDPTMYAISGTRIVFAPNPSTKSVKLKYYMELPPLSSTQNANNVIARYGGLYLYAVMLESSAFLNDAEKEMTFLKMYERTRDVINAGAARRELNPALDPAESRDVNLPSGSQLPGQKQARAVNQSRGI